MKLTSYKSLKKTCLKQVVNNYNDLPKKQQLLKYLTNELRASTTHGLSYFVKNHIHYLEKIFWIGNFVACLALAVLLLNVQYLRFIAAPTVMSVEMNYFDWNISYPTITLCPLFKPDVKRFRKRLMIVQSYNSTELPVEGYLWAISQAALDTLEFIDLNASEEVISTADSLNRWLSSIKCRTGLFHKSEYERILKKSSPYYGVK